MRSLRLHGPEDLRMHDDPMPIPASGEALVRVTSVGVCASDVHWWKEGGIGTARLTDPLVLGHEAAGVVEALGEGVTSLSVGQKVAIEPARPCMECEFCQSGHYNVCPSVLFFGTTPTDGCFRDYVAWPASLLLPVPDAISMDETAMLEPLAVGMYAAELAAIKPGETIVILGAGAIGLSVLQPAKLAGACKILVVDPVAERRDLASKRGADVVCTPDEVEAVTKDLTQGKGFDIVFECAGQPDATRISPNLARVLGRIMVVGIPSEFDYVFDASAARRKQITATFVRRSNLTTEPAIELVAEGKIDVACYATHTFSLEEAGNALALAHAKQDGVIRTIVRVSS